MDVRASLIRIRIVLALSVTTFLFAIGLYVSDREEYRYGLRYAPCLSYVKGRLPEHVDYLALGGSRMLALFIPSEYEIHHLDSLKQEVVAFSLAKSWYGQDFEYQLLSDIYKQGTTVDKIVIQLAPQRKEIFHPVDYSFLRLSTLTESWGQSLKGDIVGHASHIVWSYLARVRDVIFDARAKDVAGHKRRESKISNTCYPRDYAVNQKKLDSAKKIYKKRGHTYGALDVSPEENEYANYYYSKLVELAKHNGTEVFFLRVPRINTVLISDESAQEIEDLYGATVIRIPISIREELVENGYRDGSHLHKPGRDIVLPWLVKQLNP